MINASGKRCRENQNTHFMFNNIFFENRAVSYIKCKNVVEPGRPHMAIWRMRIARWIHKATETHSEYVILKGFFPQQKWLHKSASILRYTHIACIVVYNIITIIMTIINFVQC
jgi:hypothetical protein